MTRRLAKTFNCPTEFTLTVLGGKWKTVILAYLTERPCRYGELRQMLPKLSDKVLSERLRDLQDAGLVTRHRGAKADARHVYALTARADSLAPLLREVYAWGERHAPLFGVHIDNPLRRLDGGACGP